MKKILIVDDQACIRQLLTAEFVLEGYHVAGVGDVESALERLSFYRPDLVLLDLYLDGAEGFKLLEKIKDSYSVPVIIFTAYDGFRDDPRLAKADGYVLKGLDLGPLKRKVAKVMSPTHASEGRKEVRSWHRILESSSIGAIRTSN